MWRIVLELVFYHDSLCSEPYSGVPEFHGALPVGLPYDVLQNESAMLVFPVDCGASATEYTLYADAPPTSVDSLLELSHNHAAASAITVTNSTCHPTTATMFTPDGAGDPRSPAFRIITCNSDHYCDALRATTLPTTAATLAATSATTAGTSTTEELTSPTEELASPTEELTSPTEALTTSSIPTEALTTPTEEKPTTGSSTLSSDESEGAGTQTPDVVNQSDSHVYSCRTVTRQENGEDVTVQICEHDDPDTTAATVFFVFFLLFVFVGTCTFVFYVFAETGSGRS